MEALLALEEEHRGGAEEHQDVVVVFRLLLAVVLLGGQEAVVPLLWVGVLLVSVEDLVWAGRLAGWGEQEVMIPHLEWEAVEGLAAHYRDEAAEIHPNLLDPVLEVVASGLRHVLVVNPEVEELLLVLLEAALGGRRRCLLPHHHCRLLSNGRPLLCF